MLTPPITTLVSADFKLSDCGNGTELGSFAFFKNHPFIGFRQPSPDKFYRGRSQEKTRLQRLKFFLLRSPLVQAGSVLTFRATCSAPGHGPGVLVFSTSGVHRLFATKPVSSETSKQNGGQMATMALSGTRGL